MFDACTDTCDSQGPRPGRGVRGFGSPWMQRRVKQPTPPQTVPRLCSPPRPSPPDPHGLPRSFSALTKTPSPLPLTASSSPPSARTRSLTTPNLPPGPQLLTHPKRIPALRPSASPSPGAAPTLFSNRATCATPRGQTGLATTVALHGRRRPRNDSPRAGTTAGHGRRKQPNEDSEPTPVEKPEQTPATGGTVRIRGSASSGPVSPAQTRQAPATTAR